MLDVRFENLMQDFCREAKITDPSELRNGGNLTVDEVAFTIVYETSINEEAILVFCDFGELPEDQTVEACKALLYVNMFMFNGFGPVFSINPETNHVIFGVPHWLDNITGADLLAALRKMADDARTWRQGHFLEQFGSDKEMLSQHMGARA